MNNKRNDYKSTASHQLMIDISDKEEEASVDSKLNKQIKEEMSQSKVIGDDENDIYSSGSRISIYSEFNLSNILQNHAFQQTEVQIQNRNTVQSLNIQRQLNLRFQFQQRPQSQLHYFPQNYQSQQSGSSFYLQDYDKKDLISSVQSCLYFYMIFIVYFSTLLICSLALVITKAINGELTLFGLFCTVFNLLHCFTLIKELFLFGKDFLNKLKNNRYEEIQHFLREIQQSLIDFLTLNLFFMNRIKKLLVFNVAVYMAMFFWVGVELDYKQIPYWMAVPQLSLGVTLLSVFAALFICLCFLIPLILCEQRQNLMNINQEQSNSINFNQNISIISLRQVQLIEPIYYCEFDQDRFYNQPCYICLQEYKEKDLVISLNCQAQHLFHQECISQWVDHHTNCPVCKEELL